MEVYAVTKELPNYDRTEYDFPTGQRELVINVDELETKQDFFSIEERKSSCLGEIIRQVNEKISNIKLKTFEIGCMLTAAKKIVEHGEFQKWIEDNFDFSYPTANNFMNVYRYCLGRPDLVVKMKPSILYQIASPKFPEDLREYIFENWNYLEEIKTKPLQEICTRFKNGEIDLDSPEVQQLVSYRQDLDSHELYDHKIRKCLRKLENICVEFKKSVNSMKNWPDPANEDQTIVLTKSQANDLENCRKFLNMKIREICPRSYVVVRSTKPTLNKTLNLSKIEKKDFDKSEIVHIWNKEGQEKLAAEIPAMSFFKKHQHI